MNFNRVELAGNLTRDPELRYTNSGLAICELGMAVNRRTGKDADGQPKNEVCFLEVTVWGKSGEVCGKNLQKGSHIFVEGHLTFEQWSDADNNKRSRLKVTAELVHFLGSEQSAQKSERPKRERKAKAESPNAESWRDHADTNPPPQRGTPEGEDIPF